MISICSICNNEFSHPPSKKRNTCSIKCMKQRTKNKLIKIKCKICEKEFIIEKWQLKTRKYCSRECANIGQTGEGHPSWKGGHKITSLEWAKRNPEYLAHIASIRRARLRGAEGSHTLEEWEEVKKHHGYRCVYCGTDENITKDHIIPLTKGGTDYIDNIQPLCHNCNSSKGNRIESFLDTEEFEFSTEGELAVRVHFVDGGS